MVLEWKVLSRSSSSAFLFMQKIVTGIDVGTPQVKDVIARRPDNPREAPQILGTGYAESRGMKKGKVISVPDVARSLATTEGARAPSSTLNRKVIHTIPLRYSVDGMRVMGKSPIGMKGQRISVETFFITCLERHVHDLVSAVEEAGIEVEDIAASPLAASFVALNKMQKRVGCVLVNIGSETLSIIVFGDSIPMSVRVFPVGGTDITNDLALGLRISPEEAQQLKR